MTTPELPQFPPWHNPEISPRFRHVSTEEAAELFGEINAGKYIERWRATHNDGSLDIDRTLFLAKVTRVRQEYDYFNPPASQAVLQSVYGHYQIVEHIRMSEAQRKFLLGHELGHIALFKANASTIEEYFKKVRESNELNDKYEAFCDYFSLRLIGYKRDFESIDWDALPLTDGTPTDNPWKIDRGDGPALF